MIKHYCICAVLLIFSSCNKKESMPQYVCNDDSTSATTLRNQHGTIVQLDGYSNYAIQYSYGIDGVNTYIICDALPDSIKINDTVEFSGEINPSKYSPTNNIAGQQFFDLQLSDINK